MAKIQRYNSGLKKSRHFPAVPVAQLEERQLKTQKIVGSIPSLDMIFPFDFKLMPKEWKSLETSLKINRVRQILNKKLNSGDIESSLN